jgi:hypothetical protein
MERHWSLRFAVSVFEIPNSSCYAFEFHYLRTFIIWCMEFVHLASQVSRVSTTASSQELRSLQSHAEWEFQVTVQ